MPVDSPVVEEHKASASGATKTKLTRRDWTGIAVLLVLLPFLAIAIIPNNQIFNAYLVWAQDHANLVFFGKTVPTTWLVTLDAIVSVSFLFIVVTFWRLWSRKFREPTEIAKIVIGSLFGVAGMLSLVVGATIAARTGHKVSIGWLIAFHVLNSAGFANVLPVSLALYARVAPASLSGTLIGVYYVAFFAANLSVGWVGGFLEKMPAAQFWLLHAAFAGVAGVTFFLAGKIFGHLLAPTDNQPVAAQS